MQKHEYEWAQTGTGGKKARPKSVNIQKHFIYYNYPSRLSVLQISCSAVCVSLQLLGSITTSLLTTLFYWRRRAPHKSLSIWKLSQIIDSSPDRRRSDCSTDVLTAAASTQTASWLESSQEERRSHVIFFRYTTEHTGHAHTVSLFHEHGGSVTLSPHASQ